MSEKLKNQVTYPKDIRRRVLKLLQEEADPERAHQQQAYMKSEMPYFGLRVPRCRSIAREVLRDHPPSDPNVWVESILHLWRDATHREERYVAIELMLHTKYINWLIPTKLPVIEEMVVSGAWWDFVDALAIRGIGTMLANHPDSMKEELYQWAHDENIWKRRTTILSQLKAKVNTDVRFLSDCITSSLGHPEFFLRKGIGWALREYSKTDSDWVARFVKEHPGLSALSRKEALKHLVRLNKRSESIS